MSKENDSSRSGPENNAINTDLELHSFDSKVQDENKLLEIPQNPYFNRHFGNNLVCCFRNNEPYIVIGPHWYVAMFMIIVFFGGGIYLANYVAFYHSTKIYYITYLVTFMQTFLYLMVSCVNPGICSTWKTFDETSMIKENRCKVCRVKKSNYVVHCLECDICIRGYDHHCPWVGKCVGERNHCWFNLFILSTLVFFMYAALLMCNIF